MPNVEIVIVTFRSSDSIEPCLDSVPESFRPAVVVVENASGDSTPEIVRDRGVRIVENSDNLGFGAAANQGARLGDAEVILFLNPDARLQPGALEAMWREFDDPSVAIVGARLVHPDGRAQRSLWPYPSSTGLWAESLGLQRFMRDPADGFVVGACFAVRRTMFEQLGGFDERYWLYGEEADLCFRARASGWKVVRADIEMEHEGGASGREVGDLVFEHFARGSERFVRVHHGKASLVSYRLAGLVGASLRWPLLFLRDRSDPRVGLRRRQIGRLVRLLVTSPATVADERPALCPRVTLLSLEPWDEVWRRNQFLVRELLELHPSLRVLWVEPPQDPLHELVAKRRRPTIRPPSLRPLPGEPRVLRYQPRKWLPRVVWPFVDRSLCHQVRSAMDRAGFSDSILWINDSTYAPMARTESNRCLYDITDDWLDADVPDRERARRREREDILMKLADEVVVCSPALATRRGDKRPVHLIPNAVDVAHFRTPQPRPGDLPLGPTAVYVGTLHEDRIDLELVEELARELPDLSIVLVGPIALSATNQVRLERIANVRLLGARPYADVPGYLQHADVVIVPHAVNRFTESLDPIKAYECLVLDRPTVATPVPGFLGAQPPIQVAERRHFADRVRALVRENSRPPRATVPSWSDRARDFWDVLVPQNQG